MRAFQCQIYPFPGGSGHRCILGELTEITALYCAALSLESKE